MKNESLTMKLKFFFLSNLIAVLYGCSGGHPLDQNGSVSSQNKSLVSYSFHWEETRVLEKNYKLIKSTEQENLFLSVDPIAILDPIPENLYFNFDLAFTKDSPLLGAYLILTNNQENKSIPLDFETSKKQNNSLLLKISLKNNEKIQENFFGKIEFIFKDFQIQLSLLPPPLKIEKETLKILSNKNQLNEINENYLTIEKNNKTYTLINIYRLKNNEPKTIYLKFNTTTHVRLSEEVKLHRVEQKITDNANCENIKSSEQKLEIISKDLILLPYQPSKNSILFTENNDFSISIEPNEKTELALFAAIPSLNEVIVQNSYQRSEPQSIEVIRSCDVICTQFNHRIFSNNPQGCALMHKIACESCQTTPSENCNRCFREELKLAQHCGASIQSYCSSGFEFIFSREFAKSGAEGIALVLDILNGYAPYSMKVSFEELKNSNSFAFREIEFFIKNEPIAN